MVSVGSRARLLVRPNAYLEEVVEDVGPAIKKAIDMQMNDRKTTVIEIMCSRELGDPFRKDALSKPVRHLDKYKDFGEKSPHR